MKKTVFWLVVSMILFVIAPLVIRSGIRYPLNASYMLLVLFVPLYFVILGISVGKSIKRHWFLPVVSLALSFISYTFYLKYETIPELRNDCHFDHNLYGSVCNIHAPDCSIFQSYGSKKSSKKINHYLLHCKRRRFCYKPDQLFAFQRLSTGDYAMGRRVQWKKRVWTSSEQGASYDGKR